MLRFANRSFRMVLPAAVLLLSAPHVSAQEQCQCTAPGAESSRIANAIGGGLFAGLIAAVIPYHHATALAAAPAGAAAGDSAAPSALVEHADSSDVAPEGSPARRAAPAGAGIGDPAMRVAAAPQAATAPKETVSEGMIAPRTATMLPALAMIGVGLLLTGILFLRTRSPHRRY
jgi:hypothetical protein